MASKLKNRIWANEAIDMRKLLNDNFQEQVTITMSRSGSSAVQLEHGVSNGKSKQKPLSINQWTSAFQTYVAIYTVLKCPECAASMMKYWYTVCDDEFRCMKQVMGFA